MENSVELLRVNSLKIKLMLLESKYSLPIKGWPVNILGTLVDAVSYIVYLPKVTRFYIGRTNDIQATRRRHDCDYILLLYKTESADNAIVVEDFLIVSFYNHPKCLNDADHGGGNVSDYYTNYVYIALWFE